MWYIQVLIGAIVAPYTLNSFDLLFHLGYPSNSGSQPRWAYLRETIDTLILKTIQIAQILIKSLITYITRIKPIDLDMA